MEKRKTAKKILSLFLTLAMLLSMMSVAAFAEEGAEPPAEHTEHQWDAGEVTTEPTCTVEGCEAAKEEAVEAAGHKWDDGTVTVPATDTETGVKTFTCTVCNETKTEEIPVTAVTDTIPGGNSDANSSNALYDPAPYADEPQTEAEKLQAVINEAKTSGATTYTLANDWDFTSLPAGYHVVDISGMTLDLGGHKITSGNNYSGGSEKEGFLVFEGSNATITNGIFEVTNGNYALFIGDEGGSNNVVVDNVTATGINIYNSNDVTLRNVKSTGKAYYSVWCDENGHVTIESGEYFSKGNTLFGASAKGSMEIKGGTFTVAEGQNFALGEGYSQPVVSGGTFNTNVSAYIAPSAIQGEDGTVRARTEDDEDAVARIGTAVYTSLQDAIKAATNGQTVVLLKNTNEDVDVAKGKVIILDLNGQTVSNKERAITIQNLGTLTIRDNSEAQTGTIQSTGADDAIDNYGTLNVESGTIQGGTEWYGIYAGKDSSTNVYGTAKVIGEYWGIAAAKEDTSAEIHVYGNAEISSRSRNGFNGGIYTGGATAQVDGNAKITGPDGIYTNGKLTFSGNAVIETTNSDGGYGMYIESNADVELLGGTIKNGAVGVGTNGSESRNSKCLIDGVTISCGAVGIYWPGDCELTVQETEGKKTLIESETGIMMTGGTMNITGGTISGTKWDHKDTYDGWKYIATYKSGSCTGAGPAIILMENRTPDYHYQKVTISGGTFISDGIEPALIYVNRGSLGSKTNLEISGGTFTGNESNVIEAYTVPNSKIEEAVPVESILTGGYYSKDVSNTEEFKYVAAGYVSHTVSTPANYWNVHQRGAGWHFNASEHWQGCNAANCAEGRTNVGSHTYTSSVTTQPTYDAPGVRTYTCTVCSRSYTESIARLTRPSGGGGGGGYRPSGGGGGGTVNIDDPDVPLAGGVELNREDHFAYVSGYEDGTVRPGNNVTREEVAAIFYRLLTETSHTLYDTDANDFSDVDSGRWSNRAISTLVNAGVLSGYPDGTFRPGQSITRAEFAAIAAQFDAVTGDVENPFSDTAGHWAESLISFAAAKGWVGGYTDGTFKPQKAITRAEAMTLVNNVLEREVDEEGLLADAKQWPDNKKDAWYYYEVLEATNSHDYTRRGSGTVENWTAITND